MLITMGLSKNSRIITIGNGGWLKIIAHAILRVKSKMIKIFNFESPIENPNG